MQLLNFKKELVTDKNGIFVADISTNTQQTELNLRKRIAREFEGDLLRDISKHHSISVMDLEIRRFLLSIPINGLILDVGAGWGWHWRYVHLVRPDITIVLLDLVYENLLIAKNVLNESIQRDKILLLHGDAASLPFEDNSFDGVWTVQTTQHIPNYKDVCTEFHRILKIGGSYWDFGLNIALVTKWIYQMFGKTYHLCGNRDNLFYLRRVNKGVVNIVKEAFQCDIKLTYSEILFSPELGFAIGGGQGSILGKLDSLFTGAGFISKFLARQVCLKAVK